VLTARGAGIAESDIRAAGRWASHAGPRPYTFHSELGFQSTSRKMLAFALSDAPGRTMTHGYFNSDCIFEHF